MNNTPVYILFIIVIFLFFAARYFIKNNIATVPQQKGTVTATIKLLFFLPVFSQGLFLLWTGIIHFQFTCRSLFLFLSAAIFNWRDMEQGSCIPLSILCSGSLLLGITYMLGNVYIATKDITTKFFTLLLYILFSVMMLLLLYYNRAFTMPAWGSFRKVIFFDDTSVITATIAASLGLTATMFSKKMRDITWMRYLQLPVMASLLYTVICVAVVFIFFLPYCLLKIVT